MTVVVENMVWTWAPDDFWRVAQPLIPVSGGAGRDRDRLVAGDRGLHQRTGGKGGDETGPNPVDRGKPGSKTHVLCDRTGIPLTVLISAANVPDAHLLLPLLDSIIPIRGRRGRPRHRPAKLHADKAYDVRALRAELHRRGIAVRIARKGVESSQRLGRHRWIVEACLPWLQRNRRLVRRCERTADHFQAFADLGCALLVYRRLVKAAN